MKSNAQLVNNGATISIQANAILSVQGNVENGSGTINNNGTLQLSGDLLNNDQLISSSNSTIIFNGSTDQSLRSNSATLETIELENSSNNVILLDDVAINNSLMFNDDDVQVLLDNHNMTLSASAIVIDYDDNNFIVTNGTGKVTKLAMSNFFFPIGFSETNYNPISLIENGTVDDISLRVLEQAYDNGTTMGNIISEEVVNASWEIEESVLGSSMIDADLFWTVSDEAVNFDRTSCAVGRYHLGAYDGLLNDLNPSSGAGPYSQTRVGITELGTFIVGNKPALDYVTVSPRIFLGGAYNGVDMNDDLRQLNVIPLVEPYNNLTDFTHVGLGGNEQVGLSADFDQMGTDDDVVDWIFVELRDPVDNTLVLGTQSVLLQRDGDLVDVEMNEVKFHGFASGDYNLVIRHRNHLGISTLNAHTLDHSTSILDFTDGTTQAWGTDAMHQSSGIYTLWPGDVNGDGNIFDNAVPSDVTEVANAVLANPNNTGFFGSGPVSTYTGFSTVYERTDVNLDGTVLDNASPSDATSIANIILSHPANTGFFGSGPVSTFLNLVAQIPQ